MIQIYICPGCGYEANKYFGLCPKCKSEIGVFKEATTTNINNSNKTFNILNIRKVNKKYEKTKIVKNTQFKDFDNILSSEGGFVEGQVILLGANPGVGKSTLCISIADENTLYISSEENYQQVNGRALRINPDCNCSILNTTKIDDIIEAIKTRNEKFIIIDSLNSIEFGVGYLTTAKFADQITNAIKENNKFGIIISQVSRNGEISGMNSILHIVDTVLYLERSEISSNIIATTTKNRYGEIGEIAIFRHFNNGFEEIKLDNEEDVNEIGSTYTEIKFGHKNMKVVIESLVTVAQSSFGLRKANGYNQNRLIQLIGILSYYSKINLSDKDIYVSLSNGLFTDDISIELAMANSILSSYFKKALISEAKGEIRLNGKINHGYIKINNVIKELNHINDLIYLYKQ